MANSNPKQWGVTDPRSLAKPTAAQSASTRKLVEVLAQSCPHKSEEERQRQKVVLDELEKIVKDWVKQLPIDGAKEANAKLFNFGSYHLQVDEPGNIVDTLCVGPNFVNREHDFFDILHSKLEKMSEVAGLQSVPDAHIPFLTFKLHGVTIKLVYASLSHPVVPEDLDISHDSVIENIDDVSLRSLCGCRLAVSILELVPHFENFRTTLMCVKHWAKGRGIWSDVSEFLGESEWAILVARVCQAYPKAAPSTLVTQFFDIFNKWYWPNPVRLIMPGDMPAWDPENNETDYHHSMPIIAPAYPWQNLNSDATVSTLRVMQAHFKFGDEKCKEISRNIATWEALFEPFSFFEQYMRYLHIDITADTENDLRTLKRNIEPELRLLISKIEEGEELVCHPCPVEYATSDSCAFFIGLSSKKPLRGSRFVKEVPRAKLLVLNNWFNGWKLRKPDMDMHYGHVVQQMMGSRTWGKRSLPVIGIPTAAVP